MHERIGLPSLHGLHVFEAAARLLSFTEAARELCISQTAVSHQIKSLEAELGATLFRRLTRRIELTEAGKAWALELGEIFARLRALNRRLRELPHDARREVAISIIPSFGTRWLVPRLGRFLDRHPDVEVRVAASEQLADLMTDGFDLALRYGFGRYPGLVSQKLMDDSWVVVCAPALLQKGGLRTLKDLEKHVLLQDDSPNAWAQWLDANGALKLRKVRRTELTDSSMLIEAALRGQGVGIARWSLAVDALRSGSLVLPFPKTRKLPTGRAYYLVASRESLRRPEVLAFHAWLLSEAVSLKQPL